MKTYLLLEIEHTKPIDHLATRVEQRAWPIDGVIGTAAVVLSSPTAFQMAKAQAESAAVNAALIAKFGTQEVTQ